MSPLTTKTPEGILCEVGEMLEGPWETQKDCILATEIAKVIDEYFDPDCIHEIIIHERSTMVRCKFFCSEVAQVMGSAPDETGTWKPALLERVKMAPASGGDNNKEWSHATPSGSIELFISNPKACGLFKPGQYYYVDIHPVPAGE